MCNGSANQITDSTLKQCVNKLDIIKQNCLSPRYFYSVLWRTWAETSAAEDRVLFKMGKHSDLHLSFFQIVHVSQDFTVATKLTKDFKGLYGLGGCCLKIRDVWSLFTLKASYLSNDQSQPDLSCGGVSLLIG